MGQSDLVEEVLDDISEIKTDKISLLKTKFALDYGSGDPFYNVRTKRDRELRNRNQFDRQIKETISALEKYPKL